MKKKLLMFTLLPLVLSVLVAPTMAKVIGPWRGRAMEKNPNIIITSTGLELVTPSGVNHIWAVDTEIGVMDFIHMLDASRAKIRNAVSLTIENLTELLTDPSVALEVENKWGYVSYDDLVLLLVFVGYSEAEAEEIASLWPEGTYVRFANIGK